jgi:hypothetical protein
METFGKAKYIMYTMDNCPWCLKAKALFAHYKVEYQARYEECPEWDTYPAIYKVDGESLELIGGFNELAAYSFDNGL